MALKLTQLQLQDSKVLVRTDFNVPLDPFKKILDNSRIVASLPTIKYLLSKNCRIILMSHLGRPEGTKSPEFSLKPVAEELSKLLKVKVKMAPDCIGSQVKAMVDELKPKEILLLENLRFYPAEEKPEKDPSFAKEIASYGDFYVDDAFGCAHRAHASIVEVPKYFPNKCAMGLLLEKEVDYLGNTLLNPKRPFMAIIGGAKISTKMGVLKALIDKVDVLAIGGGMAFTFLKAEGVEVGNSLIESSFIEEASDLMSFCREKGVELLLPIDVVIARSVEDKNGETCAVESDIPSGYAGYDIGPLTVQLFTDAINKSKTILWNGPMGVFEKKPFAKGTKALGKAFINSGAVTIAGGGETLAALKEIPHHEKVSHLSTGGGATLEYIEFGTLPGIEALESEVGIKR